jgi:hypothetical protein
LGKVEYSRQVAMGKSRGLPSSCRRIRRHVNALSLTLQSRKKQRVLIIRRCQSIHRSHHLIRTVLSPRPRRARQWFISSCPSPPHFWPPESGHSGRRGRVAIIICITHEVYKCHTEALARVASVIAALPRALQAFLMLNPRPSSRRLKPLRMCQPTA